MVRPRGPVSVPIKLAGLAPGEEAYVTRRRPSTSASSTSPTTRRRTRRTISSGNGSCRSISAISTGMLIDGMQGSAGAIHVGGDGGGNLEGNLPTQPPLARYSGVVKTRRATARRR